jgi:DNA primase
MQPSDEIKSKLDIVDLIRDYIPLKAAGMNFSAPCPFHREKSPSFMVSPEKQIWHCFGCGKGGDLIAFVMEMEGLEFVEALRYLAPKAGITLRRQDPKLSSKRNRLLDIMELSRKYYHKVLTDSPVAAAAGDYLKKRGLKADEIEEWQIGYSPDTWESLLKFLKSRGYNEVEILEAGMAVKNDRGGCYDRFRGRIMFPINDINGNTIAFSARVSPEKEATEKMGKYINSPQTDIYDKGRTIFGMDKAKLEIKQKNAAIIVEGQMDAITAHINGFKNVIASSGTALTGEQVAQIKRFTNNIILAFDMDEAGGMAAVRGIKESLAAEMNIKIIVLPEGKDPDDCIRTDPELFKQAAVGARSMMDYFFEKTFKRIDISEMDGRRQAAKEILNMAAKISNKIEQEQWIKNLSEKIDVSEIILKETLLTIKQPNYNKPETEKKIPTVKQKNRQELLSESLLALLIKFPYLIEYSQKRLQTEEIAGLECKALYSGLLIYYNSNINQSLEKGGDFNYHSFKEWLTKKDLKHFSNIDSQNSLNQSQYLDRLVILADNEYGNIDYELAKNEAIKIIIILKRHYLINRSKEIEKQIALFEKDDGNKEEIGNLLHEFKMISEELRGL